MFCFLETDIREQKKHEKRTQTPVDNTVNDLRYEIKFENCLKGKSNFFIKRSIAFLSWTRLYFILGDIFFSEWLYARQPGTQNSNPKCPALQKLRLQVPGTSHANSKCPALQKLRFSIPGTSYANSKCQALQKLKF